MQEIQEENTTLIKKNLLDVIYFLKEKKLNIEKEIDIEENTYSRERLLYKHQLIGDHIYYLCLFKRKINTIFNNFLEVDENLAFLQFIDDDIVKKFLGNTKEHLFGKFYLYMERLINQEPPRQSICTRFICGKPVRQVSSEEYKERIFSKLRDFNMIKEDLSNDQEIKRIIKSELRPYSDVGIKFLCASLLSKKHLQECLSNNMPKNVNETLKKILDRYINGNDNDLSHCKVHLWDTY